MNFAPRRYSLSLSILALVLLGVVSSDGPIRHQSDPGVVRGVRDYGALPLRFEPGPNSNELVGKGLGFSLRVAPTRALMSFRRPRETDPDVSSKSSRHLNGNQRQSLEMVLVGSNRKAKVRGEVLQPGRSHYLIGNDPGKWRTDVCGYAKARCEGVYPGIDLVFYGNNRQLEYDFIVAPGANPNDIKLAFTGSDKAALSEGELVLTVDGGEIRQAPPIAYQETSRGRTLVDAGYELRADAKDQVEMHEAQQSVSIRLGPYDKSLPLVVDPILVYSTYLGGTDGDFGNAVAVDESGSAFLTGYTESTNFPTVSPIQTDRVAEDVFVTKLNSTGTAIAYSTYLGGSGEDVGLGIALDTMGSAYVTGYTTSNNYPTVNPARTRQSGKDAFVTKLNPSGSAILYSTYLGGTADEESRAIAVDVDRSAYVSGFTESEDYPTVGALQADQPGSDGFVTKLSAQGSALEYSTYLGGANTDQVYGIGVSSLGNAYVAGWTDSSDFPTVNAFQTDKNDQDAFVAKLSVAGSSLDYSTYLGGNGNDVCRTLAVDASGFAYVTGYTDSTDFPRVGSLQANQPLTDAFATKVNLNGSSLAYSTYLGGTQIDAAFGIAVDRDGSAHITGFTSSADFLKAGTFLPLGSFNDGFAAKLTPAGNAMSRFTYLGGNVDDTGRGIAADRFGEAYVVGSTSSTNFPTSTPFQTDQPGYDAFISKLGFLNPPSAPVGLSAQASSGLSQIDLEWNDQSNNERGFSVERRTGSSSFAVIDAAGEDVEQYSDSGVAPNTTYTYRVRAFNDAGNSAYSNTATASTVPLPPAPPSGLGVTVPGAPDGRSKLLLGWTDHSNNETGFRIERRKGGATFAEIDQVGENQVVFEDSGLEANATYTYRVRAFNSGGNSAYSNTAGATTLRLIGGTLEVPTAVNFGKVKRRREKRVPIAIKNAHGAETLQVTVGAPTGRFTVVEGGGAFELKPGQTRVLTVGFRSAKPGRSRGTLPIASTDTNRSLVTVALKVLVQR